MPTPSACAEVAPGNAIHALERDFLRINAVLASLMPTVEAQLGEISPTLDLLTGVAQDLDQLDRLSVDRREFAPQSGCVDRKLQVDCSFLVEGEADQCSGASASGSG